MVAFDRKCTLGAPLGTAAAADADASRTPVADSAHTDRKPVIIRTVRLDRILTIAPFRFQRVNHDLDQWSPAFATG
jgi:hypothetical protein